MQKNKNKNKNNVGFIKYITYCINLLISNIVNKKKKKLIIYAPPSTVSYLVAHYDVPELGGLGYFTKYPATKYGTVLGGRKLLLLLLFLIDDIWELINLQYVMYFEANVFLFFLFFFAWE